MFADNMERKRNAMFQVEGKVPIHVQIKKRDYDFLFFSLKGVKT